jgi:hypothetical protein
LRLGLFFNLILRRCEREYLDAGPAMVRPFIKAAISVALLNALLLNKEKTMNIPKQAPPVIRESTTVGHRPEGIAPSHMGGSDKCGCPNWCAGDCLGGRCFGTCY